MTARKEMAIKNQVKTYKVHIGGCSLKLKSSQDSVTFKDIMQVVDRQVRSSQNQYRTLSMQKKLALSCLNIAGELVCLKKNLSKQLERLESATQYVVSQLKKSSPAKQQENSSV